MPPPFFLIGPSSPTLTPAKVVDVWIRTSISAYLIESSVNNKNIPDSSIRDMLIPKCKSRGTQTDRYALSSSCQRTTIVPARQGHRLRQAVSVHHATDPTGHRRPPHLPRPVGLGGCPRINAHGPWRLEEVGRSCSTGPCTSSREHTHLPMPRSDVLQRAISVS